VECSGALTSLLPKKARLKVSQGRLVVTMDKNPGSYYLIELVTSKRSSSSRRTIRSGPSFYVTSGSRASLRKPSRGSIARIRYAFTASTDSSIRSRWSSAATLTISR
jgi:hypothetical protein